MKSLSCQTYGTQMKSSCLNLGIFRMFQPHAAALACDGQELWPQACFLLLFLQLQQLLLLLWRSRKWWCTGAHRAWGSRWQFLAEDRGLVSGPSAIINSRWLSKFHLVRAFCQLGPWKKSIGFKLNALGGPAEKSWSIGGRGEDCLTGWVSCPPPNCPSTWAIALWSVLYLGLPCK